MRVLTSIQVLLLMILLSGEVIAQETSIQLPTNDNTSGFNVTKSNGTSVFKVDGSGKIAGDGSGLKNVRPVINYIGGNQMFQVTANYGSYNCVRSVTLTAPSNGVCFVMASGYARWESLGWDLLLSGILCDKDPNSSWAAENEWYKYLNILTDYNCADSSDQYTSFSQHRCIPVGAGSHNFYLWANKYTTDSKTRVDDVNLTVIFFPTGGTGTAMFSKQPSDGNKKEMIRNRIERSIDGHSPPPILNIKIPGSTGENLSNKYDALKEENAVLRKRLDQLEQRFNERRE